MKSGETLLGHMRQFTGSETLYRHGLVRAFTYTEGVKFFAEHAGGGAYWLLDIVATEPAIKKQVMEGGFASIRLKVTDRKAVLTVDDGNDNVVWSRSIEFTDCPERPTTELEPDGSWSFYVEPNQLGDGKTVMTMMWPSER